MSEPKKLTDSERAAFGAELLALRQQKQCTVQQVADGIGRSVSAVYMAQSGKPYSEPLQQTILEYLDALTEPSGHDAAEDAEATAPRAKKTRKSAKRRIAPPQQDLEEQTDAQAEFDQKTVELANAYRSARADMDAAFSALQEHLETPAEEEAA